MPYSAVGDLLLGDLELSPLLNKQDWVDIAAEEMDSKLGWVYALPLRKVGVNPGDADSWKDLPLHQQLLLKQINNKLASGRLILTLAIAGEGTTLHAYGWNLVREAMAELMLIANGELELDAERLTPENPELNLSKIPSIHNPDSESLLDGFENTVMRGVPWYTRPGKVP